MCKFIASDDFEDLKLDTIAVNLSVVQCMQKNLADDLFDIMKNTKCHQINLNLKLQKLWHQVHLI